MKIFDFETWIKKSLLVISQDGALCKLHIDEILPNIDFQNKKEIFSVCIEYFNKAVNLASEISKGIKIELHIELKSTSNYIQYTPKELSELLEHIDEYSMPELLLFEPTRNIILPKLERYMSPLPFSLNLSENCYTNYTEYRTLDEMRDNEKFTRWFNLIYWKE